MAAHIEGPHLSVASTGDCTAVVGSLSETDTWVAKKLTNEHNSDNNREVKRILANHPETEHHHIIKGDRLLGMLAPLRAFGDFKFKWPRSTIEETLGGVLGEHAVPANYKTPPYLTAVPEVTYHRLTPRDKFLILGSDGLWDMMTPMQVGSCKTFYNGITQPNCLPAGSDWSLNYFWGIVVNMPRTQLIKNENMIKTSSRS